MRVALVHGTSFPDRQGSVERYLHDLAGHLDRLGHEVTLVLGSSGFAAPIEGGIKAVHVAAKGGRSRLVTRAAAWLARHRQDVVHALSTGGAVAGLASRHPTIFFELGALASGHGSFGRRSWDAAIRWSDAVVCPSDPIAQAVVAAGGRSPFVVPLGLQPPSERPTPPAPDPLVVYAGSPSWDDTAFARHQALGAAMTIVRRRRPEAVLLVPATGPDLAPADGWIPGDALRTLPRRLARWPERWPPEDAHVVVVNADWQAQRAALEALAAGRPAVAVRGCGAEDLGAGDLVQLHDGDANSQADAILAAAALAADPATLARCVSVAERHSWDVVSDDLSAIHDQVLRRAPVTA